MAALTKIAVAAAGVAPSRQAVSASDTIPNPDGRTVVFVENGNAASLTVTVTGRGTVDDVAIPNRTITIPAGAARFIGPFNAALYNDANGNVTLGFSVTATVTASPIQLP